MAKKFLSRDEILNVKDIHTEEVYVKAWDAWVCVKSLTGKERDQFERSIVDWKGSGRKTKAEMKDNIRARLVALTVVDPETLEPLFKAADVAALGEKSAAALDTIYEAAQRLSKISDDDVEELTENFTPTHDEDSISSLHES